MDWERENFSPNYEISKEKKKKKVPEERHFKERESERMGKIHSI